MSIQEIMTDLTLVVVGVIAVMYWFEYRSRELFRQKTETLIKALEARAMSQESERLVQTQKIVTLGRSLTAHLENAATQLDRIETILETCKNECAGETLEDTNG